MVNKKLLRLVEGKHHDRKPAYSRTSKERNNGMAKKGDLLRDMDVPMVLGYELDRKTLTPVRRPVITNGPGDYGCDPLGDGTYRMVPSGDIVDEAERFKRLRR